MRSTWCARRVADVDLFVAVSDYYAAFMRDYLDIPADKLRVARLGVNVNDLTPTSRTRQDPFTIGYFSRVAPEKGLHNLAEAYRVLRAGQGHAAVSPAGGRISRAGAPAVPRRHYEATGVVGIGR